MAFKIGDRVSFTDPAGRIVSDVVTGLTTKKIGYAAYGTEQTIPALLLARYGWVAEISVIGQRDRT